MTGRIFRLIVLLALLSAAACAPATPPPPPTPDVAQVNTQAAATIYARLTAEVTATFTPTLTATATETPVPTATFTPEPTATVGTPVPSPTEPIQGDGAQFLTTAPPQYTEIRPNEIFNIEFDLLNVGTTTWGSGYSLVWVGGEPFTNQRVIPLEREVKPGEKGVFIFGAFGSEDMDPHTTVWQLYNASGQPVPGGRVWFTYVPV